MRIKKLIALMSLGLFATPACADVNMEVVPTAWRLNNAIGNSQIQVYYTSSSCGSGLMTLAGTSDEANRFWATVISAKIAGKAIGVFYNPSAAGCPISSFYLKEQ